MAATNMITTLDEFEEEYRRTLGKPLRPSPWKEASAETIKRFGVGVGDFNPLWRDEEYAKKSRFGMLTAPPTFVFAVDPAASIIGGGVDPSRLSNEYISLFYTSIEMEFHRPIWVGDRLFAQTTPIDIIRKNTKSLGPVCFVTGQTEYYNQRMEVATTTRTTFARFVNLHKGVEYDRGNNSEAGNEAPDPLVWERKTRGSQRRHWEEVHEGEQLPDVKKGTYTLTEMFYFTMCVGTPSRPTRKTIEEAGTIDFGGSGRADAGYSQKKRAQQGQFDFGYQRVCWVAQGVTDWMGDDATLKKLSVAIRHPNLVGDTNTVKGKVRNTHVENGEHLVDVELWNENQAGLVTAPGLATIALPLK
ncbi:MAG: hypothetical protein EXR67_07385 [Dehalococcoidia bacterium]|nr:hypothetical protein [Dehalococcoidia bacterium]